jgi:hypothetical protein
MIAPIGWRMVAVVADKADEENELLPNLPFDLITDPGSDAGTLAGAQEFQGSLWTCTVKFSKNEILNWPAVPDDAGLLDGSRNVAYTAITDGLGRTFNKTSSFWTPFWKRDDRRASFRQGDELWNSLLCVPELDREKYEVGVFDLSHSVNNFHLRKRDVPQWANDAKSMRPHSFEMCTSGNKSHVIVRSRQPGAKISSDASRSENYNLQWHLYRLSR